MGSSRTSDPNCEATIPNYSGSQPVITSISLPNGEQYTFTYESTYGLLSRITYPNGAYVSYTWALNSDSTFGATMDFNYAPQGCEYNYGTPAISTRTVSFNGSTPALEQSFTYSTNWNSPSTSWTTKTTTVQTTDSLRNKEFTTVYTYSPVNQSNPPYDYSLFAMQIPVEQTTTVDDWSGNPLQTVTKSWVNQYEMQGQQVADNGTVTSDQFFVSAGRPDYRQVRVWFRPDLLLRFQRLRHHAGLLYPPFILASPRLSTTASRIPRSMRLVHRSSTVRPASSFPMVAATSCGDRLRLRWEHPYRNLRRRQARLHQL